MKKLLTNYTFTPSTKQIVFTEYSSISLEKILVITNVTTNTVIYEFDIAVLGGSVAGNILTLDYDTATMDSGDILQIFYDEDTDLSIRIDKADSNITYIGKSTRGSSTASAVWQIQKILKSGTISSILWVNGSRSFTNIWDNRASLTYS